MNVSGGHSTYWAKLNRKAALIRYSLAVVCASRVVVQSDRVIADRKRKRDRIRKVFIEDRRRPAAFDIVVLTWAMWSCFERSSRLDSSFIWLAAVGQDGQH